ncbi:MAG: DNA polymerase III subunit beta [Mariniblastus sp.]|nr:DNA polymerase III subunit beta [Mariniblastus sp.]
MKIKIKRDSFFKAFQIASAVAPARSPKVILQNVKLDVSDKETILTATDIEIGVRLNVPDVEVESEGSSVIPVGRLSMILRESSDEYLVIEANQERTLITGNNSRFELSAQNPDEFPEVANFGEDDYFEVASGVFKEMIHRTLFATDAESSRYALGGILLEMSNDTMIAVGTDGRRLAKMEGVIKKVGNPQVEGTATIVPSRAMQLIERILPEGDSPVQLAPRSNDLLLKEPNGIFYTRLVEGRFPKWRDVLPKRQVSNRIDIPVGPMYSALRQAAIVSNEESRGVDFTFGNGSLVLSNNTAEVGQSRVEMPVPYNEEELTITLDHRYVADFLKALQPDKTFTMDIENGEQAAYCVTDDNYGYVIMPLSKDRR